MSGKLDRLVAQARELARTWRARTCCCVVPLRAGLTALGYLNVAIALILMMGTATGADMFLPMVARVQASLLEDDPSAAVCVLAPAADLAANTLLLVALYRNDVVLLQWYVYYSLLAIAASIVVYSLVVALINALYLIVIAISLLYQIYVIILARSLRMEIKLQTATDSNSFTYHKRNESLVMTPLSTNPETQEATLQIVKERDIQSPSKTCTLCKCSTLNTSKTDTLLHESRVTPEDSDITVAVDLKSSENEKVISVKPTLLQDASVSVTPLDILASKTYHSTKASQDLGRRHITEEVTLVEASKSVSKEKDNREKLEKTVEVAVSIENEVSKIAKDVEKSIEDTPQKKKRGIFKRSPKAKDTDKKR